MARNDSDNFEFAADVHRLFIRIQKKGRAIKYEDGNGDCCIRLRETTSNTHVNPARDRPGHTKYLTNGHVAFAEYHQSFRSKDDTRQLVHQCGDPKKKKGKSQSHCANGKHISLQTIQYNNATTHCFNYIRTFVIKNRWNSAISTVGKMTVARVNLILKATNKIAPHQRAKFRCPHTKKPCFVIYCARPK